MHNFDKKILITGGSGFIGRNLINKLIETGYRDITATYWKATPSNIKNVKWIKVNLIEGISINFLKNIDTVYMLAAVSSGARDIIERPEIFVTNNVLINQNTIINAIESKVKNII
jgi:nucleoside-diphosphate-sugar epimerase